MDKSTTCVACGNNKNNIVFNAKENMFGLGHEFLYLECSACHSIQLIKIPDNFSQFYPSNYYAFQKLNESGILYFWLKKIRWFLYKHNLFRHSYPKYLSWLHLLEAKESDSIADIGCGNGQILYEMKCCGFKNLYGFDYYLNEEKYEKGFSLMKKEFDEVEGVFDIVMLHHSFEHMEFPNKVFEKLKSLVKKGGRLLIRLPVTDAAVWEKERLNWFQLDAPRHLFIPSVEAMVNMGENQGFKLLHQVFDSNEGQFIGTELYKKGKPYMGTDIKKEFTQKEISEFRILAKEYNNSRKGDQVCLYFIKEF